MRPLAPAAPHAIIMVGIPGAGKTAFAEHFAQAFQAPFVNVTGLQRAAGLTDEAAEIVGEALLDELIKVKRTLVYEGATALRTERQALAKRFSKAGLVPLFVWVQTESVEAKRRAMRKQADGTRMSDDEFEAALDRFMPLAANEKAVVISGRHTFASQVKIVVKRIAVNMRPGAPDPQPRYSTRDLMGR